MTLLERYFPYGDDAAPLHGITTDKAGNVALYVTRLHRADGTSENFCPKDEEGEVIKESRLISTIKNESIARIDIEWRKG